MSTLAFQPDAERYYSEGYWRAGDLWGEFVRSASAQPAKHAVHVDEQQHQLRRASTCGDRSLGAAGRGWSA